MTDVQTQRGVHPLAVDSTVGGYYLFALCCTALIEVYIPLPRHPRIRLDRFPWAEGAAGVSVVPMNSPLLASSKRASASNTYPESVVTA
jgi:hypothetical protein